jgi:hypothetical protein
MSDNTPGDMLGILQFHEEGVTSRDLRLHLAKLGDPFSDSVIWDAGKLLRDMNYQVIVLGKGRNAIWKLASNDDERAKYFIMRLKDHYSEVVSDARATYSAEGSAIHDGWVGVAIRLGECLNMPHQRVIDECRPVGIRR